MKIIMHCLRLCETSRSALEQKRRNVMVGRINVRKIYTTDRLTDRQTDHRPMLDAMDAEQLDGCCWCVCVCTLLTADGVSESSGRWTDWIHRSRHLCHRQKHRSHGLDIYQSLLYRLTYSSLFQRRGSSWQYRKKKKYSQSNQRHKYIHHSTHINKNTLKHAYRQLNHTYQAGYKPCRVLVYNVIWLNWYAALGPSW